MDNYEKIGIEEIKRIFEGRKPKPIGRHRSYSVLVPLVEKDGTFYVLFEIRAKGLKRQPGEICFPGGRMEKNETPLECAVRETAEELNIPSEQIEVLAPLDYIYAYSNFTLYAYLGRLPYRAVEEVKVNEAEVKEVFLVPLSFFIETEPHYYDFAVVPDVGKDFPYDLLGLKDGYEWNSGRSEVYIYNYGQYAIWGLTGRIIANVAKIIKEGRGFPFGGGDIDMTGK